MPAGRDRMDGNERFRSILTNGNPKVLGALLTELGENEAKKIIGECYREEKDSALIHCVKKACDGKNKKDKELAECCALLLKYGADLSDTDDLGKTALHWAAENKNEPLVTKLVSQGADSSIRDDNGRTPLYLAVAAGSLECVNAIVGHSKNPNKLVNETDKDGVSPTIVSVQKGNAEILSALISAGADINVQENNTKRTPLHYALYIKRRDLFEQLLENGASLTKVDHRGTNIIHRCCAITESSFLHHVLYGNNPQLKKALKMEDGEGATPVIVACQNGNIEQLRQLEQAEAPFNSRDKFKRCALHHCVENSNTECAEMLLQSAPSLVHAADEEGLTPLHMAVIAGNATLIELLLEKGANLAATDNEKHSVTHWATVCGHTSVLNVLLDHGAKLSTPDKYSAYPIHYASQMSANKGTDSEGSSSGSEGGSIQILRTLLKNKVSSEVEDKDNRTPIIWAASAGNSEACRVLMEHGADVNRSDKDDLTALHCAASRGHSDCVDALIKNCKVTIDPVDKNQCTPLFYATTLGHNSTIKSLLKLGADCSHRDSRGRGIAHCATVSGSVEVLETLKEHKVDLWAKNLKGDQPLHEAAQSGHIDSVQYLLREGGDTPDKSINSANQDGRTCLHIAALTNNVWLCNVLLEKGANVNCVMSNKGKYYTPYDAALIKGFTEAKDIIRSHGGVQGSEVSNHAANTIQARYKYHKKSQKRKASKKKKKKEEKEEGKEKEQDKDEGTEAGKKLPSVEEDKDDENENERVVEKEKTIADEDRRKGGDNSRKSKSPKKVGSGEKAAAAVLVGSKKVNDDGDDDDKAQTGEKIVYVERSTQVSTVSPGVLMGTGESTEEERSEKENRPRPQSSKSRDSTKSKTHSENQTYENRSRKSGGKINNVKHSAKEDKRSDDEETLTSDRASSHGNSSDIDSLDSGSHQRMKKSPIARNKHKNGTLQSPTRNSKRNQNTPITTTDNSSSDNSQKDKHSSINASNKGTSQVDKDQKKFNKTTHSSGEKGTESESDYRNNSNKFRGSDFTSDMKSVKPTDSESGNSKKSERSGESDIESARKSEKHSNLNSDKDKGMGSLFSKRKVGSTKNESENKNMDRNQDQKDKVKIGGDGYTDNDDSEIEGENQDVQSPRRKKTRPSKLISRIQESVKRYEDERKSIRRLHQIRRAQIYSAPMYDVSLFRAIVENSHGSNQGTPSTNNGNWDEYLQEQVKIIQEERKTARKLNNRDSPSTENSTQSPNTPKSPENGRRDKRPMEREGTEQRIRKPGPLGRSITQSAEAPITRAKSNMSKTSPGFLRSGRPERAQTAGTTRPSQNRSATSKSPKTDPYQQKHEEQQRLLRHAYRPFGQFQYFNGTTNHQKMSSLIPPRPSTCGQKPLSATSSKTDSTVGSTASVRHQRTGTYTIMTPYGSRKLRDPMENPKIADACMSANRKRHPLIFQDPDEYDKQQRENNAQQDIPEENGC